MEVLPLVLAHEPVSLHLVQKAEQGKNYPALHKLCCNLPGPELTPIQLKEPCIPHIKRHMLALHHATYPSSKPALTNPPFYTTALQVLQYGSVLNEDVQLPSH